MSQPASGISVAIQPASLSHGSSNENTPFNAASSRRSSVQSVVSQSPHSPQGVPGMSDRQSTASNSIPSVAMNPNSPTAPNVFQGPLDGFRPRSRIGGVVPNGRRTPAQVRDVIVSPFHQPTNSRQPPSPGCHLPRSIQSNPYRYAMGPSFGNPNTRLREAPSNATLRPRQSRGSLRTQPSHSSIRDGNHQPLRTQQSRSRLQHVSSQQRLSSRGSISSLRAGPIAASLQSAPSLPSSGTTIAGPRTLPASSRTRMSAEEARRMGIEVMRRRAEELRRGSLARPRHASNSPVANLTAVSSQHISVNDSSPQHRISQSSNGVSHSLPTSRGGSVDATEGSSSPSAAIPPARRQSQESGRSSVGSNLSAVSPTVGIHPRFESGHVNTRAEGISASRGNPITAGGDARR
jgi:hypothetical protein